VTGYRMEAVEVDGGTLATGVWGDTGPLVVAAHGITSHHRAWALIAPETAARFVAPDLRGRGGSRDLPGPYGMARHAEDLAAVIAAHGGGPAVVVGHSMGCWAAVALARSRPELVSRLVLVDGGPPLAPPPGTPADPTADQITEVLDKIIGKAYARLSMTFPDRAAYRELWRAHPALAPEWNDTMAAYADYDLVEADGALRPACRLEAALRDARDNYAWHPVAPEPLPVPAVFLRAERGMLDQPEPMFRAGVATAAFPGIVERDVPGTNHYTIALAPAGAKAVADAVRE
jgi:lipase